MSMRKTPAITGTDFGGPDNGRLLLLGPSIGTSADTLWSGAAARLREHVRVVGWDLPGHGRSGSAESFTMAELAAGVLALADEFTAETFHYAGDSVGGAWACNCCSTRRTAWLRRPLLCTGATIGTPDSWRERAAAVRSGGTSAVLSGAVQRWFGPGFPERHPDVSAALLRALRDTDPESYAQTCEALAGYDVTDRLHEIPTPVLAIAGSDDVPDPAGVPAAHRLRGQGWSARRSRRCRPSRTGRGTRTGRRADRRAHWRTGAAGRNDHR